MCVFFFGILTRFYEKRSLNMTIIVKLTKHLRVTLNILNTFCP